MTYYGARGVDGATVVIARFEPGVVVTPLELKAGFEDFGWDVDEGSGEVGDKSWNAVSGDLQSEQRFSPHLLLDMLFAG